MHETVTRRLIEGLLGGTIVPPNVAKAFESTRTFLLLEEWCDPTGVVRPDFTSSEN
jgi:hypothetical protein